jgi:hypothetical protein
LIQQPILNLSSLKALVETKRGMLEPLKG